jgi:pentatricopeptide repeat protein
LDAKAKTAEHVTVQETSEPNAAVAAVDQPHTTGDVRDAKKSASEQELETVTAINIDEITTQDSASAKDTTKAKVVEDAEESDGSVESILTSQTSSLETSISDVTLDSPSVVDSVVSESTSQLDSFVQQLEKLANNKHYAEIPAVFEAMLAHDITPTPSAYNALLVAAIHIPKSRYQVVPKALDVYSDMLRRHVVPDHVTYTILVDLLSAQALEVVSRKNLLEEKLTRYGGMEEEGKFMFLSDEMEYKLLGDDDSLSLALKMFDTAASIHSQDTFTERTYRLLISACAAHGKVEDMARLYGYMEAQGLVPRADMFTHMIHAFAVTGDLNSAVECYNEYKALAIAHDNGELVLSRRDDDVYAAVIKAYTISKDPKGATNFFGKLEASALDESRLSTLRDTVGLRALLPEWLKQGRFEDALAYARETLSSRARDVGLSAVSIRAADRNNVEVAIQAFNLLSNTADLAMPASALGAMYIRSGDVDAAERFWHIIDSSTARPHFIEFTIMQAVAMIGRGQAEIGLRRARLMFARVRDSQQSRMEVIDQIDEAVQVIGNFLQNRGIILESSPSMELLKLMIENTGLMPSVASHVLAGLGPDSIGQLSWEDIKLVAQVQSSIILNESHLDIAHSTRFSHLLHIITTSGRTVDMPTEQAVEKALSKLNQPELVHQWNQYRYLTSEFTNNSGSQFSSFGSPATSISPSLEDTYDPYAASTDNRGSVAITDLLEKTHGKFSSHLNDALTRFKNMRRLGRHPRFFTYAKLITAAAKDNRLGLAHDILNMAKTDVPYLPQYRIVRYGWITILDAMVAACLTVSQRQQAEQFHRELVNIGAAPSANTFGLYITTLKESTKTFDEATEAVKIFHQAKSEGVEPSSFLYNALIGKLGKARRIDDCLFYFQEMRSLAIRPTSVTYGTIVNALCRVSDEKFAEELFEEMESMPNYKPRPAPYHSMMQFFLATKRDRSKVLSYYERMRSRKIEPTSHTYKLLIDTYATLDPVDMQAAEGVLEQIRRTGDVPEAVHYSSLIHAKGCVLRDMEGARALFDSVLADPAIRPQPCLFQALFESMVANHQVEETLPLVHTMGKRGVEMTPYIANALIHGWAHVKDISKAEAVFKQVPASKREPSTYEAMTRAYMANDMRDKAVTIVNEAMQRGYPTAVANKILDLVSAPTTTREQVAAQI